MRQVLLALKEFPEIEQRGRHDARAVPVRVVVQQLRLATARTIEFGVDEVTDGFARPAGLKIVAGRWFGARTTASATRRS